MPSLGEKIEQLTWPSIRKSRTFHRGFSAHKSFLKFQIRSAFYTNPRPGHQEPDMPGGSRHSRAKESCEPEDVKYKPSHGSSKKTTTKGDKAPKTSRATEEVGTKRRSTSASSDKKSNPSSPKSASKKELPSEIKVSFPTNKLNSSTTVASQTKAVSTGNSTACLQLQVKEQLLQGKKDIVDKLMAQITEWLDKKLEPLEELCDGEGCSSGSHGSSSGNMGKSSKRQSTGAVKRSRQREDSDDNGSDNDNGSRRNRNNKRTKKSPDEPSKNFACPYLKFDPEHFGRVKTCCGPGWPDIHRVKEHLNRSHALPEFQCSRCYKSFKDRADLDHHYRATPVCPVQQPVVTPRKLSDGFDKTQSEKINKRTRKTPGHERWISWYCILFETEPSSPALPSPYQGEPNSGDWKHNHTSHSRYGEYADAMRALMTSRIRCELERSVDRYLGGCEQSVRMDFMRNLQRIAVSVHGVIESGHAVIPPPAVVPGAGQAQFTQSRPDYPPDVDPHVLFEDWPSLFDTNDPTLFNTQTAVCGNDSAYPSDISDTFNSTNISPESSNTSADGWAYQEDGWMSKPEGTFIAYPSVPLQQAPQSGPQPPFDESIVYGQL